MNIMAHMVEKHSMIEIARIKAEKERSADAVKIELARITVERDRIASNQKSEADRIDIERERMGREERLELARMAHADKERETIERERAIHRQNLAEKDEKLRETTEAFAEFKKHRAPSEIQKEQGDTRVESILRTQHTSEDVSVYRCTATGCTEVKTSRRKLQMYINNMHAVKVCKACNVYRGFKSDVRAHTKECVTGYCHIGTNESDA
jgi:hypothetical protein